MNNEAPASIIVFCGPDIKIFVNDILYFRPLFNLLWVEAIEEGHKKIIFFPIHFF